MSAPISTVRGLLADRGLYSRVINPGESNANVCEIPRHLLVERHWLRYVEQSKRCQVGFLGTLAVLYWALQ